MFRRPFPNSGLGETKVEILPVEQSASLPRTYAIGRVVAPLSNLRSRLFWALRFACALLVSVLAATRLNLAVRV